MPTSWLGAGENAPEGVSDTVTATHDIYNKVWGKVSHRIMLMLRHQRRGDSAAEWDVVRAGREEDGFALRVLVLLWNGRKKKKERNPEILVLKHWSIFYFVRPHFPLAFASERGGQPRSSTLLVELPFQADIRCCNLWNNFSITAWLPPKLSLQAAGVAQLPP